MTDRAVPFTSARSLGWIELGAPDDELNRSIIAMRAALAPFAAARTRAGADGGISAKRPSAERKSVAPLVLSLTAALSGGFAAAQLAPALPASSKPNAAEPARPAAPARTIALTVPLQLGPRFLGDITVEVDQATGGDASVDGPRLLELLKGRLGAELAAALAAKVAGRELVPLDELSFEGFTISFDMAALALRAEVASAALSRQQISLGGLPPPDPASFPEQADLVGGVQINLLQGFDDLRGRFDRRPLDAIVEGYVTVGGFEGVTLAFGTDARRNFDEIVFRDVTLVKDFFGPAIRALAGEVSPRFGGFQTSGDLVGIGVERRYQDIRPFQNIRPAGRRQIVIERPSRVEFIVNGVRVGERDLAPGPYQLDDFTLAQGSNNVRLLIEDATGRQELLDYSLFYAPTLLGEGIVDFGGYLGFATAGDLKPEGDPIATGFVLAGVTSGLTLGANAQVGRGVHQAGAAVITGFANTVVQADVAYARNWAKGFGGLALGFDLRQTLSVVEEDDTLIDFRFERRGARFASVADPFGSNPERFRLSGSATLALDSGIGAALGGSYSKGRNQPDLTNVSGSLFGRIGRFLLTLTGSYSGASRGASETRAVLGVSLPIGDRWTASARADALSGDGDISISRFRGIGINEISGALTASRLDGRKELFGEVEYSGQRLELEVSHRVADPGGPGGRLTNATLVRASTFIGFADGLVGFGRDGRDGFVLVRRHPTLDDAKVTITNGGRVVARSDGLGTLFVPVERAYSELRNAIDVDPLPLGYDIGAGTIQIFPGFGAGYAQTIGSDASYTLIGNFTNRQGQPIKLIVGELVNAKLGPPVPFFTNAGGRFVANRIAPGRYDVVIRGRKVGGVTVAPGEDSLVRLPPMRLDVD